MMNLLPESAGNKKESSTLIESSPDENIDTKADVFDIPLAQWTRSLNKRKEVTLKTSIPKVGSIAKLEPVLSRSRSKRFVSLDIGLNESINK